MQLHYGVLPFGSEPDTLLLVSIDQDRDKKWHAIGSAFPLYHNGKVYLITAGHVVAKLSGFPIYVLNSKEKSLISLRDAQVSVVRELDLAVVECSLNDLASLFGRCNCVKADYRVPRTGVGNNGDIYQVYGFPKSKNKISRSKGFGPNLFRVSLGAPRQLPKRSKLAGLPIPMMCFEIDPDRLFDDEFKPTFQLGKFEGLSGGPVIRHAAEIDSGAGSLVGMFVEWHSTEKVAVVVPIALITSWIEAWCQ
ncbi:hypothetical protein CURE108131_11895 [Cupriavidus respiraculi]|uniref:Trypsin-like peptidase domain-containing protein n=1 Tax=Cupriavidus respiraculi TaxID=195930 RepID=A0ABM8WVU1_9BURK|nr:hypothetical protein [Cupriavidus respiraculi]CAG9171645.1 hypothetical protein LMG21510_01744 [Cupriavidus respiraculi]